MGFAHARWELGCAGGGGGARRGRAGKRSAVDANAHPSYHDRSREALAMGSRAINPNKPCRTVAEYLDEVNEIRRKWGNTKVESKGVPYCTSCVKHVEAVERARLFARAFTFLSLLTGLLVGWSVAPYWGVAIGILAVVGTVAVHTQLMRFARSGCSGSCVDVYRAIAYLGWSGTLHKFEITSRQFAHGFMTANQRKLVNLTPEAMNLLSAEDSTLTRTSRSARRYVS